MSAAALAGIVGKTKPLSVTLSAGAAQNAAANATGYDFGNNSASVSGGSGFYTYAWSHSGDSGGSFSLGSPTAGGTDVSVSGVASSASTTVTCKVTDTASGRTGQASTSYEFVNLNIN